MSEGKNKKTNQSKSYLILAAPDHLGDDFHVLTGHDVGIASGDAGCGEPLSPVGEPRGIVSHSKRPLVLWWLPVVAFRGSVGGKPGPPGVDYRSDESYSG
ncbi:hypothetical protein NL676_037429 [Syzygium grande]|nr:hypothetical protein NL676_037429 [Syzygium grande]